MTKVTTTCITLAWVYCLFYDYCYYYYSSVPLKSRVPRNDLRAAKTIYCRPISRVECRAGRRIKLYALNTRGRPAAGRYKIPIQFFPMSHK